MHLFLRVFTRTRVNIIILALQNHNMKTKMKENYVVPQTEEMELISENLICDSQITGIDSERIDYGNPENLTW